MGLVCFAFEFFIIIILVTQQMIASRNFWKSFYVLIGYGSLRYAVLVKL